MRWTIGIITVPERATECMRIKGMLEHQIGDREDIEVVVNSSVDGFGKKRQDILDTTYGEYINFVDDDDLVAHDYIDTIYPLLDGIDYIGFPIQMYEMGKKQKPTYHSLKYKTWHEDEKGWYRNVSHLNPIKREIAKQGNFEGGIGEDFRWAQQVKPESEHYIDRPMYFYFHALKYSLAVEN